MLFATDDLTGVIGVCIPIIAMSIPIVAIISFNWRKAKVAEYRAILVQNMLDKDFTPDEIERVLKSSDGMADKLNGKCDRRRRDRDSRYA